MIGSLSSDSTASAADTDHDDETDEAAVKQELKEVSPDLDRPPLLTGPVQHSRDDLIFAAPITPTPSAATARTRFYIDIANCSAATRLKEPP